MSIAEEVELLRQVPLFQKIDTSKLKLLAFTSERMEFETDQVLVEQGEPGDDGYVIIDGVADVIVASPTGPVVVAHLQKNDFFGEIAIFGQSLRSATVIARSPLVTLKISKEFLFQLLKEFPEMSLEMMRELADRIAETTKHLTDARVRLRAAGLDDGS